MLNANFKENRSERKLLFSFLLSPPCMKIELKTTICLPAIFFVNVSSD